MAHVLLISNPVAARTNNDTRRRVIEYFERAGWQTDLAVTTAPGDAKELARQGVTAGVDVVAVFGGDGTSMEAVASIVGSNAALGLIPGGTGNLLAGNLRIPRNPLRAARAVVAGKRRTIDLGRVVLPDGAHYFGVACGAGIDARVMGETATENKRRWGIGAYWATTLRVLPGLSSTLCRITADGESFEVRATLVLIMNCGEMIPPLIRIRPEINPEDGYLDLIAVTADSPWQGIRGLLHAILAGRRALPPSVSYLRYARAKRFTVEPEESLPVQFDGDPVGTTPITAEVLPGALAVMVPG